MSQPAPRRLVLAFAALLLVLTACGGAAEVIAEPQAEAAVVEPQLTGTFDTLNGTSIDLASLEGEDVVLWFWAPW